MKKLLINWKAKRNARAHRRGYRWAITAHYCNGMTLKEIGLDCYTKATPFNMGCREALFKMGK